jgi:hypothetical protein
MLPSCPHGRSTSRGGSRRRGVAAAFALVAVVLLAACSNQGEGGRCDTNAENSGAEDCASGLVCIPVNQLGRGQGATPTEGRCCPADRSTATAADCRIGATQAGDAAVPEGGPFDGGIPPEPDAADDGGTEGGDAQ